MQNTKEFSDELRVHCSSYFQPFVQVYYKRNNVNLKYEIITNQMLTSEQSDKMGNGLIHRL